MQKALYIVFFVSATLLSFSGCESNNSFMTKSGIESKLQGKWEMVRIPVTQERQTWQFSSGLLYVSSYVGNSATPYRTDTATYEIVAKIATPYLIMENPAPNQIVSGRWVVINLDKKYLTLNRQSDGTFGTKQREFIKI